jgi:hypothetical protein
MDKELCAKYWDNIVNQKDLLLTNGFIKLPPLSEIIDSKKYIDAIIAETNGKNYTESSETHTRFLEDIGVSQFLSPILYEIAKENFDYRKQNSNQYHIARYVKPGDIGEQYKTHFDSHLFTVVFPLQIPTSDDGAGELLYLPNIRRNVKSEILNIIHKIYYKRYANKVVVENLVSENKMLVETFYDCSPLIFLGRTTLHTNRHVSKNASHPRLTLLAHFFDPSPKYGVGSILRFLRRR